MFNYNLRKRLAKRGRGTPLRPEIPVKAYVFAMFNKNEKISRPTSESNFGLFKADGSIGYRGLKFYSATLSLKSYKVSC